MTMSLMGAGVFAAYVHYSPQASHVAVISKSPEPEPKIEAKHTEDAAPSSETKLNSTLLIPAVINNEVKLDQKITSIPVNEDARVYLVNLTLHSLKIEKARALGVDVKNRVALMDFNPALQKGYGSIEEGNLIKSLQMALGQFKEIDKFQIIIEGKPIDSLGNIDMSQPIDVLRVGQSATTSEESSPSNPN